MKKLIAIFLIPLSANAELGPVTKYLSNEPATLLDVGMMRLETLTNDFEDRVGLRWTQDGERTWFEASISSQFDPDADKIYVTFHVMNSEPSEEQMAEGCTNAMTQMNIWLQKRMHVLFEHTGSAYPSHPPDFYNALREMFELRCYFSSGRDTSEGRFWASRKLGNLGDRGIRIGKWNTGN